MTGAARISEIRTRADHGDVSAADVQFLLRRMWGLELVFARAGQLPHPTRMSDHIRRRWGDFGEAYRDAIGFDLDEVEE